MDLTQAALLGLLQGIAEWLPISSSGQAMLAMVNLLGVEPEAALSVAFFLHLGSLLAVLVYFREDLIAMLRSAASQSAGARERRTLSFLIYSTLATGIVGVPLYLAARESFARIGEGVNLIIGVALLLTALVLRFSPSSGTRSVESALLRDMLLAGVAQGIAVVPGISRSGITVAALLMLRFRGDEALRLSFLMAVPAIAGANLLSLADSSAFDAKVLLTGIAAAFIASLAGIKLLLGVARSLRFEYFCALFGILALLAWAA
ncbi:MAG: undecaprenyl-diphosphate phosphatase [Euryarchaeota archaeon]|nr:undecaprenyl-diphosphate phosphatase [Euryarchaeota archaeon]